MSRSIGYEDAYHKAKRGWTQLNEECYKKLFPDRCISDYFDELAYIQEHFDEMEQVKIIWDDEHYLKIKWENFSCWWADCNCLGYYYCIMLPIDKAEFKHPYTIAQEKMK